MSPGLLCWVSGMRIWTQNTVIVSKCFILASIRPSSWIEYECIKINKSRDLSIVLSQVMSKLFILVDNIILQWSHSLNVHQDSLILSPWPHVASWCSWWHHVSQWPGVPPWWCWAPPCPASPRPRWLSEPASVPGLATPGSGLRS